MLKLRLKVRARLLRTRRPPGARQTCDDQQCHGRCAFLHIFMLRRWVALGGASRGRPSAMRCCGHGSAACRRTYTPASKSPWDELFATSDPGETPEAATDAPTNPTMPRSVLHAGARADADPRRTVRRRDEYDVSSLTHAESQQFRRIFQLLEHEEGQPTSPPAWADGLEGFAERNALAPRKPAARGGGVGTRFEAVREGVAAGIAPDRMEQATDAIWEALQAQPTAHGAWAWAEENVWGKSSEPAYGPSTAYFAPALHMLLLTLRDRFHRPHMALAIAPHTREFGPLAYVVGCTSALYAEIVRTQWLCLRDLHAVLATVREARQGGVLAGTGHGEDVHGMLRAQIERVRAEARHDVLQQELHARHPHLSEADQDMLQVVELLREVAGPTSQYADVPAPARAPDTPRADRPPKPPARRRAPRAPRMPRAPPLVFPMNDRVLRTPRTRTDEREPM